VIKKPQKKKRRPRPDLGCSAMGRKERNNLVAMVTMEHKKYKPRI
jgi:hypothetical protein